MSKIILIGPGAIGLCVGAALIEAGHDVTFVSRQPFDALRVAEVGVAATIQPVTVVTDPGALPHDADWVVLCVKAHQVAGAAEPLRLAMAPGTRLAILQNGVEHVENVAPYVADAELVPVIVDIPATRTAPGEAVWHHRANMTVADDAAGQAFRELFAGSFASVTAVADLKTRAWQKLCVNAPGGAILALTGQTMRVFHQPGIAEVARAILLECVAVGRAEGAVLDDGLVERQMAAFMAAAPDETNSMYNDWKLGLETEWNARNAVLVRKGRQHGIATLVSDMIVPLLAAQHIT